MKAVRARDRAPHAQRRPPHGRTACMVLTSVAQRGDGSLGEHAGDQGHQLLDVLHPVLDDS